MGAEAAAAAEEDAVAVEARRQTPDGGRQGPAPGDRVGLSWRPALAAGILAHRTRIDVVEVIADDYFEAPRARIAALRTLAREMPVFLHGIGQGLASTAPADERRLAKMAALVDGVRPAGWSEHLAFVRGGGIEIGHLAAPPRNQATVEGACENIERARRVVGSAPEMENVATLIDPPGSSLDEAAWVRSVVEGAGCGFLLDLHNVYANAENFGFSATEYLDQVPLERVRGVHVAGGRMMPEGRVLDDHLHEVPDPVYELLTELAARVAQPLTVVLERDGAFPAMGELLEEMDRARAALALGRARRGEA